MSDDRGKAYDVEVGSEGRLDVEVREADLVLRGTEAVCGSGCSILLAMPSLEKKMTPAREKRG